jgi:hypothetical protein
VTALTNNGYAIREKNEATLTVSTQEVAGRSVTVSFHLEGAAKENELVLGGKYQTLVDGSIGGTGSRAFVYDISNTGRKGSVARYAFEALEAVAKSLEGQLFYTRQDTRKQSLFE